MIIPIPNATGEPIIIPIPNADPRDVSTLPLLHTHIYSDITSSFARRMDDIVAKGIFSGFDRAAENGEHIGVTFWKSTYEGNGNKPGEVTISKDDYTVK